MITTKLFWSFVQPLENINSVVEFVQAKGVQLPLIVLVDLIRYHAAVPVKTSYKLGDSSFLEISYLLSYTSTTLEGVAYAYQQLEQSALAGQLYPLLATYDGNYVCIDLTLRTIVYWQEGQGTYRTLAPSWRDFLYKLS